MKQNNMCGGYSGWITWDALNIFIHPLPLASSVKVLVSWKPPVIACYALPPSQRLLIGKMGPTMAAALFAPPSSKQL
ncbi:hypothetical protein Hanom_Chr03g00241771 [Helianthus anomalus]